MLFSDIIEKIRNLSCCESAIAFRTFHDHATVILDHSHLSTIADDSDANGTAVAPSFFRTLSDLVIALIGALENFARRIENAVQHKPEEQQCGESCGEHESVDGAAHGIADGAH